MKIFLSFIVALVITVIMTVLDQNGVANGLRGGPTIPTPKDQLFVATLMRFTIFFVIAFLIIKNSKPS